MPARMPFPANCLVVAGVLLLTGCDQGDERAGSMSVIARSNEIDMGNDSANLQAAAFEMLVGKTRENAIVLLEQQSFSCEESECTYVRRYRDSFWAANLGVGQREKRPGSRLNKRLESTTIYTLEIRAARISQTGDIEADVSRTSNYD
jgi:hypothetical protein